MTIQINGTSGISGVDGSAGTPALQGSDTNTGISFGADTVNINTGGTTRATVDSSGRLGIGDSAPKNTLDCAGNVGIAPTAGLVSNLYYNGGWKYKTTGYGTAIAQGTGGFKFSGTSSSGSADGAATVNDWVIIDNSGNLQFNSGYGSAATAYGCRAWVNFNGTSTVAIRASGNVSSVTDNGTGNYTVNFTTAMPDANYMAVGLAREVPGYTAGTFGLRNGDTKSTVAFQVYCYDGPTAFGDARDSSDVNVAIFR